MGERVVAPTEVNPPAYSDGQPLREVESVMNYLEDAGRRTEPNETALVNDERRARVVKALGRA